MKYWRLACMAGRLARPRWLLPDRTSPLSIYLSIYLFVYCYLSLGEGGYGDICMTASLCVCYLSLSWYLFYFFFNELSLCLCISNVCL